MARFRWPMLKKAWLTLRRRRIAQEGLHQLRCDHITQGGLQEIEVVIVHDAHFDVRPQTENVVDNILEIRLNLVKDGLLLRGALGNLPFAQQVIAANAQVDDVDAWVTGQLVGD